MTNYREKKAEADENERQYCFGSSFHVIRTPKVCPSTGG
jgi:hypothetical protein